MDTYRETMITIALIFSIFFTVPGDSRSVNISSSWLLPQNDFPVFYRHFRDRVTWFEADAVCQFHHAQLATVESSRQFESIRGYLKELDVTENVWIGLKRNSEASEFTWTNYQPLAKSGYFRETVPRSLDPVCVVTDPTANFKWHSLHCGGPEVASFVCELPVPYWASKSNGCMTSMVEGMTVTFLPEQPAIQLTKECSQGISKNVTCKGNMKQSEIMEKLSCPNSNKLLKPFFKPVKPILDQMSLRTMALSTESDVEDYAIEMATIAQYNDETFQTISRVIGQGRNVNLPQEMSIAQEPIKVSGREVMNNNGIYSAFINGVSTTSSTSTHASTTTNTNTTSSEVTSTTPTVKSNTFAIKPSVIGKRIVPIIFDTMTTTTVKTPAISTYATTKKSTTIRATTKGLTTTDSSLPPSIATTTSNHHQYHKPTTSTTTTMTTTPTDISPITVKISSTEKAPSTEKIHIGARVLATEITADDHRPPTTTLKTTSASQTISNKREMPMVSIINAKIPYTVRPVTAKAAVITTQKPYVDQDNYQTTDYPVKHVYKKIDLPAFPTNAYVQYKPTVTTNTITTQKSYDEVVEEIKYRATERPIKRVYKKIDIPTFLASDLIPYKLTTTNADGFTSSHFNHTIAAISTSDITTETASKKTTTAAQQLTAPPGITITNTSKEPTSSSSTTTDSTTIRTTNASVSSTENDNRTSTGFVKDNNDTDHKLFALKWNPTTPSSSSSLPTTSAATTSAALTTTATKATTTADITTAGTADITTTTIANTASTTHHKINYNAYTEHPNHSRHIIRPKQQHHHSYPYILYRLLG